MVLFKRDQRWTWWPVALWLVLSVLLMLVGVFTARDVEREKERVGLDDLFLDAVRVDCPADPAYVHASECIRTRRGVGFFFVDDNGVPRVVSVVGVGRIQ
ncbi:hypothetical protein ACNRBV_04120 [Ralstonia pseudosolanacearum]|uniref:Transmembrane protein n=1 Tax=Ralstonia solanacearum TaxID=305 RepID=A0A0S4WU98_RALSL|nr:MULTISPECIES: hypothetical protein [Ralstonia]UZF17385.1 hypothetical protein LH706_25905 [Ralstonia solanacearum]MCD9228862.1 hypothetical protein [Ralstonia pseudosolanacearum]MCK4140584.1 hypothetical protein [Ralstonia pseudosolanacearum]RAA06004.1 hypothetical protein DOT66_20760 [Ralstonia pseudosolanacearum]UQY85135.1 hypothetical protein JNO62_18060 [Ralstonia pseudosolanacearum]